jgi:hypothetical protein
MDAIEGVLPSDELPGAFGVHPTQLWQHGTRRGRRRPLFRSPKRRARPEMAEGLAIRLRMGWRAKKPASRRMPSAAAAASSASHPTRTTTRAQPAIMRSCQPAGSVSSKLVRKVGAMTSNRVSSAPSIPRASSRGAAAPAPSGTWPSLRVRTETRFEQGERPHGFGKVHGNLKEDGAARSGIDRGI